MAMDSLTLVSNPGSASRKYAVYHGTELLAQVHFELINNKVYYSTSLNDNPVKLNVSHLAFVSTELIRILKQIVPDFSEQDIGYVALRVVAPSSFFQEDHIVTDSVINKLQKLEPIAPLHIQATLSEYILLKKTFGKAKFIGISDSQALSKKPDQSLYYAIPFSDSQKFDIKRFGYHGLSIQSVINSLKQSGHLSNRVVVCHLGGGASVAAVKNGTVIDSTMGFSPLEGVAMATRSGSVDVMAYETLKQKKKYSSTEMYEYLNSKSGLLGMSELSDDIRTLLVKEHASKGAERALKTYVYHIQQAIGAMAAALNGADTLVFTGTVGIRSHEIRKRICVNTMHLGFAIKNYRAEVNDSPVQISDPKSPAKIFIVPTDETGQMAHRVVSIAS